jgi:S1-C subfamily serine protease
MPDSPAYQAGLRQGDILVSLDGQVIDSDNPFINLLFEYEPGDVVTFRVVKDKDELDIQVALAERPNP